MSIKKFAVLGAGNGGCAVAADLTLRGFEIRLFSRSESTLNPIAERGGIELVEDGVENFAAPFLVSPHLPPVVNGADLIIIAAPAVAHEYLAKNLAQLSYRRSANSVQPRTYRRVPSFREDPPQCLGVPRRKFKLCETVTLTYICRMPRSARVEIYRRTTHFAARPFRVKTPRRNLVREIQGNLSKCDPRRERH